MSTWTGGRSSVDPDDLSDLPCTIDGCTTRVPVRFYSRGLYLCREHALHAWSVVNEQLGGVGIAPEPRGRHTFSEAERRYGVRPIGHTGVFNVHIARDGDPEPKGVVYYVRTGGRIKIGHSTRIEQRLSQYPPDLEILYLQAGGKDLEQHEHRRFRAYLADGREWFQDREEVTNLIAAMANCNRGWERFIEGDWWRRRKRVDPEVSVRRIAS